MALMTFKEFKTDYERETGTKMIAAAWRVLYSQYREAEAEAIAGGRDDVPAPTPIVRCHSETCYEAIARGAECICGLIPWDEDYHDDEELATPAVKTVLGYPPPGDDDVPF